MERVDDIVRRVRSIFGPRLLGLFAFGSRITGKSRVDSDLDVGVWLDGPLRRQDSWVPWVREFEDTDPVIDPTFLTTASFDGPGSWLLEALHDGVEIWFDPTGELATRLGAIGNAIASGKYRRTLFMGLPYYAREAS